MKSIVRPRAGFTLLELLVVVSIIAILTTVGLGVLGLIRQRSLITITKGSLDRLKMALDRYQGDFDDYPPSDGDGLVGAQNLYTCLTTTKKGGPYMQAGDMPTCDATGNGDLAFADQWKHPIYYLHHHDYGNKPPNKRDFRLISPGPNGVYEDGVKDSDDIVNWNKDNPQ